MYDVHELPKVRLELATSGILHSGCHVGCWEMAVEQMGVKIMRGLSQCLTKLAVVVMSVASYLPRIRELSPMDFFLG